MIFMKKNIYVMKLVLLMVFITGFAVSYTNAEDTCVECHKNIKLRSQNKILSDYYNNWKDSTHEIADVKCKDCHGGDPTEIDKEKAHKDDFSSLTTVDRTSFKKVPERCGKCHEAVLKNFMKSEHYKALIEKGNGPHCSTCHGSVNVGVYYTSVISRSCKGCHNEYTNNRPEIVGEADKILHRINVSHALKRWVLIEYHEEYSAEVEEILTLYRDVAESWHTFDFSELDQKSLDLLNKIKSLINRGLEAKKMIRYMK